MDEGVSYYFTLAEVEAATSGFSKKIGKGSVGPVYSGKMKDGKEVAVKMMADSSSHGAQQFATEVKIAKIHIFKNTLKRFQLTIIRNNK